MDLRRCTSIPIADDIALQSLIENLSKFLKTEKVANCHGSQNAESRSFYECIRNDNAELLKQLIEEHGLQDNLDSEVSAENVSSILAKTYEEIEMNNVQPSLKVNYMVISKIIDSRFTSTRNKMIDAKLNIENVKERISILVKSMNFLALSYCNKLPDNTFMVIGKFIIFSIYTLKNILKTTYEKLPWNEMEFCLTIFLLSLVKTNEVDVTYLLVLDRRELLMHLKEFADELNKVNISLCSGDLYRQVRMTGYVKTMEKIINNNSKFKSLFHNHQVIRDVYSSKYVESYLNVTISADFQDKERSILAIARTLQVTGEYFKSTPQSPNMSESVNEILSHLGPKNVKSIITNLRDSLSHVHTLERKLDLEHNQEVYFKKIRDDLERIRSEMINILNVRRRDALLIFICRILRCEKIDDIHESCKSVGEINLKSAVIENSGDKHINKLQTLIEQLQNEVSKSENRSKNCLNEKLFDDIYEKIDRFKNKNKISEIKYTRKLESLIKCIRFAIRSNDLSLIHKEFEQIHERIQDQQNDVELESILHSVAKINGNLTKQNVNIDRCLFEIHICVISRLGRVENISKFKFNLENKYAANRKQQNQCELVDSILSYVGRFINNADSIHKFEEFCSHKRKIHQTKLKLIGYLSQVISSKGEYTGTEMFGKLVKQLDIKKPTEDKILKEHESKNFGVCKNEINKLDDIYGALKKSINMKAHNIFTYQKLEAALRNFVEPLKMDHEIITALDQWSKESNDKIKEYYEQRLQLLKKVLYSNGQNNYDIITLFDENKEIRILVEALLFDLLEILENMSKLSDEKLFLDEYTPVLTGKTLRNYLAHGNVLVELFSYYSICVLVNSMNLIKIGTSLFQSDDSLIGQKRQYTNDFMKNHYLSNLYKIQLHSHLKSAIKSDNIKLLEECIEKGADIHVRYINGWTTLHLAAACNSLSMFQHLRNHNISTSIEDHLKREPFEVAVTYRSEKIIENIREQYLSHVNTPTKVKHLFEIIISAGCIQSLNFFLNKIYLQDEYDLLHMAAEHNNKEILEILLERNFMVDKRATSGYTALHVATICGHVQIIEILLSHGADIFARSENGFTALHLACKNDNATVVELLLKNNAFVTENLSENTEVLKLASHFGGIGLVKMILLHFQKVYSHAELQLIVNTKFDETNVTLMHVAALKGYFEVVKLLVSYGASVDCADQEHKTPLHYAALYGYSDIADILLKNGANVNAAAWMGVTPLCMAIMGAQVDILNKFLEEDFNLSSCVKKVIRLKNTPLYSTAAKGNEEVVNVLLNNGANFEATICGEFTPLHYVAVHGGVNSLRAILQKQTDPNVINGGPYPPLHLASWCNNVEIVTELLERGADKEALCEYGTTPLHIAAQAGSTTVVRILLEAGVSSNCRDTNGNTPLHWALLNRLMEGHIEIIQHLLNGGADVNAANKNHYTPLHIACYVQDNVDDVRFLIANGAQVNAVTVKKETALHAALGSGHENVAMFLLDNTNVSINAVNEKNETPLFLACSEGSANIVDVLLMKGADLNLARDNITPLEIAITRHHEHIAIMLIDAGAEVTIKSEDGLYPLHVAALHGFHHIAETLIKAGADPNVRDNDNLTPLHYASIRGYEKVCAVLLKRNALVNATSSNETTALFAYAEGDHMSSEIVNGLLTHCTDVEAKTNAGKTALMFAAEEGFTDIVNLLVATNKVDIDNCDNNQCTALHFAVEKGHQEIIDTLIKYGADVYKPNVHSSVLHLAVSSGNIKVVKQIVQYVGTESSLIDREDGDGDTPLMWAIEKQLLDIVDYLLNCGADINSRNKLGRTPLHWAAEVLNRDILKALLKRPSIVVNIEDNDSKTALDVLFDSPHEEKISLINLYLDETCSNKEYS